MKLRFLFFFLLISWVSFSQTDIDLIRASNYYSKAVSAYDSGKYQEALNFLKESQINLKGKTNNDLVFLKIMSQYKIKDYEAAYSLLLQYFNGDFKRNRSFFKNVKPYRLKHNINYDNYLTEQFLDIENKYKALKGINNKLSVEAIAYRIITEKKEISPFIRNAINTKDISLTFRKTKGDAKNKDYFTETLYFDVKPTVLKNSVILLGKKDKTDFTVICNFNEEYTLNTEAFYYTFSHNKCTPTVLNLGWEDALGGQEKKGLYDLSSKKFIATKKEVNAIDFTNDEKEFLGKDNNLEKLKAVLQKQGYELL